MFFFEVVAKDKQTNCFFRFEMNKLSVEKKLKERSKVKGKNLWRNDRLNYLFRERFSLFVFSSSSLLSFVILNFSIQKKKKK